MKRTIKRLYVHTQNTHLVQEATWQPRPYDESVSIPVQTRDPC